MTAPAAPTPVVLDTSAVLAWLRGEPGAAVVDPLLGAAVPHVRGNTVTDRSVWAI